MLPNLSESSDPGPLTGDSFFFPGEGIHSIEFPIIRIQLDVGRSEAKLVDLATRFGSNLFRMFRFVISRLNMISIKRSSFFKFCNNKNLFRIFRFMK
jgi:hypothetical protein